jgi:hypothetical protein
VLNEIDCCIIYVVISTDSRLDFEPIPRWEMENCGILRLGS